MSNGDFVYFRVQPADRPIGDEPSENLIKIITEPWECMWVYHGQQRNLKAPAGYIYDGASIDRWAWTISGIVPDGMIRAASLAHDIPYRAEGGRKPGAYLGASITNINGNAVLITRAEADWVFYAFMRFVGMSRRKSRRAWLAVRIG